MNLEMIGGIESDRSRRSQEGEGKRDWVTVRMSFNLYRMWTGLCDRARVLLVLRTKLGHRRSYLPTSQRRFPAPNSLNAHKTERGHKQGFGCNAGIWERGAVTRGQEQTFRDTSL